MALPVSDKSIIGKVAVMVKPHMQLNGTFARSEFCPFIHVQAQINHCGINAIKFGLETKFAFVGSRKLLCFLQQRKKHALIQLPGTMLIGIGQCRFPWGRDSKVSQLTFARSQTLGYLAQRVGFPQLAKQHRNELLPTAKTFTLVFSVMFANHCFKLMSWKKLQQLAEQTTIFTHSQAPLYVDIGLVTIK
jgi:hypothetical protein